MRLKRRVPTNNWQLYLLTSINKLISWNVRGINNIAERTMIKEASN